MTVYFLMLVTLILRAVLWGVDGYPGKIKIGICLGIFFLSGVVCITSTNLLPLIFVLVWILVFHIFQLILAKLMPSKSELWKILSLLLSLSFLFLFLGPVPVSAGTGMIDYFLESLSLAYAGTAGAYNGLFKTFLAVTAGLLVVIFEVNHFLLFILGICHLPPAGKKGKIDTQILARGRIIGFSERALIFTLVLLNQIAAVGFVMAAKALTRFRDMEKKEWAEYVLIGTLISTIFSFAVSLAVKALL